MKNVKWSAWTWRKRDREKKPQIRDFKDARSQPNRFAPKKKKKLNWFYYSKTASAKSCARSRSHLRFCSTKRHTKNWLGTHTMNRFALPFGIFNNENICCVERTLTLKEWTNERKRRKQLTHNPNLLSKTWCLGEFSFRMWRLIERVLRPPLCASG